MRYKGRTTAVSLAIFTHSLFVVYFTYSLGGPVHPVGILGYPVWFFLAYWIGRKFDQAAFLAEKDMLTNLYNRRYMIQSFAKLTAAANKAGKKCFVLMIDCDNFKSINDRYGHQTGDEVLVTIGEVLIQFAGKNDLVARWGGDEFLWIGHYSSEERLRQILQAVEHDLLVMTEVLKIPVSLSIGTAIYPDQDDDLHGLIKIADRNMYRCKTKKSKCHER
ncbi:GGDEF domain-containing protein [Brevibacillus humidisoli]|uniref:GGDEF domain-containing protein n=1 Tax=Brevibacillus humidisoli TaxID=2895522 RepID=UPI001E422150|nr:GGDEF domain-containing protein [Brevibacillus humidisoli]UFJ39623.1 GGDEF domain-containing protein [Brevibacillus humidisoli]